MYQRTTLFLLWLQASGTHGTHGSYSYYSYGYSYGPWWGYPSQPPSQPPPPSQPSPPSPPPQPPSPPPPPPQPPGTTTFTFASSTTPGWSTGGGNPPYPFTHTSDRTPSSGTGPSAGVGGSGSYYYAEVTGRYGVLFSLAYDGSACAAEGLVVASVEFLYHMYGSCMGELRLVATEDTADDPSSGEPWSGEQVCGCEELGATFCNYDYGASGFCERCADVPGGVASGCDNWGLPAAGAADCYKWCWPSSLPPPLPPPAPPLGRARRRTSEDPSSGVTDVLWSLSGDQGNAWQAASADVYSSSFAFEYESGSCYRGDAAVALVTVVCGAPSTPGVGGDPITTFQGREMRYWLSTKHFTPILEQGPYVVSQLAGPANPPPGLEAHKGAWVLATEVDMAGLDKIHIETVNPATLVAPPNATAPPATADALTTMRLSVGGKQLTIGEHTLSMLATTVTASRVKGPGLQQLKIGNGFVERIDIQAPGLHLCITSAKANKFVDEEHQVLGLHLDLDFLTFDQSAVRGALPEMWGLQPMTEKTRLLLDQKSADN